MACAAAWLLGALAPVTSSAAPQWVGVGPNKRRPPPRRAAQPDAATMVGAAAAVDGAVAPTSPSPPVVSDGITTRPSHAAGHAVVGTAHALAKPRFRDRRRRIPTTRRPADFGDTLRPGEHFRFDVTFAGNPAGLAEASIVAVEPDPRGGPPSGAPKVRMEGHARTSGVVSMIATVTDDMVTYVDARTGAALSSENVLHYSGWAPRKYKHRVTEHTYEGRGQVRIVDTKDDRVKKKLKRVPVDTFDPLSAMAWVRSLDLEAGESDKAHVVDGTTLLRIEIEAKGVEKMNMPSIGVAMGLGRKAYRIDGTITRVDRWDQAVPGKRVFSLRAWLSDDERKIPLVMESDMWVGAIRLVLTAYDPPPANAARRVGMPASP